MKHLFQFPPRNADGGSGAAGSPPAAPGGAGGVAPSAPPTLPPGSGPERLLAQPPGGLPPGEAGAPGAQSWAMPEGFPDRLRADSADDFHAKLAADWKSLRDQVSRFTPPKSVDDYKVELSEKAKPYAGDLANDGLYKIARDAALAAGMPAEVFSKFVGTFYDARVAAGDIVKPTSAAEEAAAFLGLGAAHGLSDDALAEKMLPVFQPLQRAVDKICDDAKLPQEAKAAAYALMETANGMRFLKAMIDSGAQQGLTTGGDSQGAQGLTHADLQARIKDPRADRNSPSYDPAFAAQIDADYKRKFG